MYTVALQKGGLNLKSPFSRGAIALQREVGGEMFYALPAKLSRTCGERGVPPVVANGVDLGDFRKFVYALPFQGRDWGLGSY
ncbi:hypothetical protein NIES267_10870 [Calothrix parasitica NIES-267]|uniref:Uncharacterized protein n=1 Tax=Calothrix parasitica NIES-267 TaxID=1973488 RepID=A0A1Z4LK38_9CYAN|nr:hypothetical protein NIES267_10870 [Calothrix parasitica NIES-267]